jgi:hypothetical protein
MLILNQHCSDPQNLFSTGSTLGGHSRDQSSIKRYPLQRAHLVPQPVGKAFFPRHYPGAQPSLLNI